MGRVSVSSPLAATLSLSWDRCQPHRQRGRDEAGQSIAGARGFPADRVPTISESAATRQFLTLPPTPITAERDGASITGQPGNQETGLRGGVGSRFSGCRPPVRGVGAPKDAGGHLMTVMGHESVTLERVRARSVPDGSDRGVV